MKLDQIKDQLLDKVDKFVETTHAMMVKLNHTWWNNSTESWLLPDKLEIKARTLHLIDALCHKAGISLQSREVVALVIAQWERESADIEALVG